MPTKHGSVLFQAGVTSCLMNGIHDGDINIETLSKYGNFGIGTFNAIDGELIAIDGKFYRVPGNGQAEIAEQTRKTPFAVVTFFEPHKTFSCKNIKGIDVLNKFIDGILESENYIYAIRIYGKFSQMKIRSLYESKKPYQSLQKILPMVQTNFKFNETEGSMIGFRFPQYLEKINIPGYHFHYINSIASIGGHVFDAIIDEAKIEICLINDFIVHLPMNDLFKKADLNQIENIELA